MAFTLRSAEAIFVIARFVVVAAFVTRLPLDEIVVVAVPPIAKVLPEIAVPKKDVDVAPANVAEPVTLSVDVAIKLPSVRLL